MAWDRRPSPPYLDDTFDYYEWHRRNGNPCERRDPFNPTWFPNDYSIFSSSIRTLPKSRRNSSTFISRPQRKQPVYHHYQHIPDATNKPTNRENDRPPVSIIVGFDLPLREPKTTRELQEIQNTVDVASGDTAVAEWEHDLIFPSPSSFACIPESAPAVVADASMTLDGALAIINSPIQNDPTFASTSAIPLVGPKVEDEYYQTLRQSMYGRRPLSEACAVQDRMESEREERSGRAQKRKDNKGKGKAKAV